jgi:hypothetical protein
MGDKRFYPSDFPLGGNGSWDGCETDDCLGPFGGLSIDIPVVGDWNRDNTSKIGIYRQGTWYLDLNGNGNWDGGSLDQSAQTGKERRIATINSSGQCLKVIDTLQGRARDGSALLMNISFRNRRV